MKCMQRIKAYFGWNSHRAAGASEAQDDNQASSRLEQNLAWIPTFEAPKPLGLPPPACPPLGPSTGELVSRYRAYIAQVETLDAPVANAALREAGQRLARDLLGKAIDLSSSKAQELSPDIYWLMQSAALASLFADGAQSEAFVAYRNHVHSYKDAALMTGQVGAFDLYVTSRSPPTASGRKRNSIQLTGRSLLCSGDALGGTQFAVGLFAAHHRYPAGPLHFSILGRLLVSGSIHLAHPDDRRTQTAQIPWRPDGAGRTRRGRL